MAGFRKAERKRSKLRLALCGPSGSGKTYSALLLANELGSKVAVIDTEHGSADLYAEQWDYDVLTLNPPYTPERYIEGIKAAVGEGYDVLIIDSLTHAWSGEGGVLEMHDKATAASRTQNSYTAWRDVTPRHNALVNAILGCPIHVIITMRSKTAYDMVDDGKGKKKPIKIGLAPIQRDGMEYEFTIVMDLMPDTHVANASKDRTGLFDGKPAIPSSDMGRRMLDWLNTGRVEYLQKENVNRMMEFARKNGWTSEMIDEKLLDMKLKRDTIPTDMRSKLASIFSTNFNLKDAINEGEPT